jgi:hypothetical protein
MNFPSVTLKPERGAEFMYIRLPEGVYLSRGMYDAIELTIITQVQEEGKATCKSVLDFLRNDDESEGEVIPSSESDIVLWQMAIRNRLRYCAKYLGKAVRL